jgi:hypothetical protein
MKQKPQISEAKKSKNKAILWILVSVVAIFYAVSWIRTGDSLRMGEPLSRFPVDHETKK